MEENSSSIFSDLTDISQIAIPFGIEVIVGVFAVIENAILMLVLLKDKKLKSRIFYFILSMAIADIITEATTIYFNVEMLCDLESYLTTKCYCLRYLASVFSSFSVSNLIILSIAIDRLYAITYPISYHKTMNKKAPIISTVICWILTTLALLPLFPLWNSNEHGQCGFLTVVSKSYLYFRHVLFTIIPCIGLFFISLAVIHQIREFNRRKLPESVLKSSHDPQVLVKFKKAKKKEIIATINLSVTLLGHILFWTPLTVYNIINDFSDYQHESWIVTEICVLLLHFNAVVNPFLYAYRFKECRMAFGRILRCEKANEIERSRNDDL